MIDAQAVEDHILQWLRDYLTTSRLKGFVVGVSGGIDSAVVSTLCSKTGVPTIVVEMPIHQAQDQITRGKKHIEWLTNEFENTKAVELDLTPSYDLLVRSLETVTDLNANADLKFLTLSNTRSRLRMTSLYALAGLHHSLVCGTGNKVEDFGVGFYTKYGDGGVDLSPIADLMKSEVYELGAHLEVNESILNARPTDGLWDDGRTDEDQIGATYDELEWAMNIHEMHGDEPDDTVFSNDRQKEIWSIYLRRHRTNRHKMNPIPVCSIPSSMKHTA